MKHNGRRPKLTREEKAKRDEKRQRTDRDGKLFNKRYGGLKMALGDKDIGKRIK
jgi:hypothetical protein